MKKVVVTGGAGFIGSNIVYGLNKKGISDVVIVDDLSNGDKSRNMNALAFSDYLDKDVFLDRLEEYAHVDAIIHQGACTSTTETNGKYMMRNNYEYSKRLLHFCLEHEIPFIYASSAAVYGNGENGFREEQSCEDPLNVYAFSKYAFDNYVRRLLQSANTQITGLRYFNVYGPQENHKGDMASVFYKFYQQHARGEPLKLFAGSEEFLRDFIYVKDVVQVTLYFLQTGQSGIYNCGCGKARSFSDIAAAYKELLKGVEIQTIPFPEHLEGKYQEYTQADLKNLRRAGYDTSFTTLEEGADKYLSVLRKHDGYLPSLDE